MGNKQIATRTEGKELAPAAKDIIAGVSARIKELGEKEGVAFPKNSNPQTALRAAHLILSEMTKSVKKGNNWSDVPVLEHCTTPSIYKALLDMVMLGLNPSKKQCYFIPYGKELQLSVSYMGKMAIARNVRPDVQDINSQVVWADDEFEYELKRGKVVVVKHSRKIENPDSKNFKGAYCEVYSKDDVLLFSDFMTKKEILESWKASKTKPFAEDDEKYKGEKNDDGLKLGSLHYRHMGEMVKRTVINKVLKYLIASSDDSNLVVQQVKKAELENSEAEFESGIDSKENTEVIDITPEPDESSDLPETSSLNENELIDGDANNAPANVKKKDGQSGLEF